MPHYVSLRCICHLRVLLSTCLYTINNVELFIVINICDIARLQPSVFRFGLLGSLRVPPVALHYVRSSNPDLASLVFAQLCYAIIANDLGLTVRIQLPD